MAFTPPPTPPNSGDPANFNPRADAFLGWFPTHIAELNAAGFPNMPVRAQIRGTAALPIWSFEADPDTGMWSPGANQLAWSTGGSGRMLLSASALQVDVPLTGTAVVSGHLDTTAGRVPTVGHMGWGREDAISTIADFNADLGPSRLVRTGNLNTTTGAPPGATSRRANGIVQRGFQGETSVILIESFVVAGATQTPRLWFGSKQLPADPMVWAPPLGLPNTINANGVAIRDAGGMMTCTHTINLGSRKANGAGTFADPFRTGSQTWAFPVAFLEAPAVEMSILVDAVSTAPPRAMTVSARSVSAHNLNDIQAFATCADATEASVTVHLKATGRWHAAYGL